MKEDIKKVKLIGGELFVRLNLFFLIKRIK